MLGFYERGQDGHGNGTRAIEQRRLSGFLQIHSFISGHRPLRTMCVVLEYSFRRPVCINSSPMLAYNIWCSYKLAIQSPARLRSANSTKILRLHVPIQPSNHRISSSNRFQDAEECLASPPSRTRWFLCNPSASCIEYRDSPEKLGLLDCPSRLSTIAAASRTVDLNVHHAPQSALDPTLTEAGISRFGYHCRRDWSCWLVAEDWLICYVAAESARNKRSFEGVE